MNNDSRTLLTFFLCGLVMVFWMSRTAPKQSPVTETAEVAEFTTDAAAEGNTTTPEADVADVEVEEVVAVAQELQNYTIENDDVRLTFSNYGGVLMSAELKQYQQTRGGEPSVTLTSFPTPAGGALRWDFNSDDGVLLSDAVFVEVNQPDSRTLEFVYPNTGGLHRVKRIQLGESCYFVEQAVVLRNNSSRDVRVGSTVSLRAERGSHEHSRYNGSEPIEVAAYANDSRYKRSTEKINKDPKVVTGSKVEWAAVLER